MNVTSRDVKQLQVLLALTTLIATVSSNSIQLIHGLFNRSNYNVSHKSCMSKCYETSDEYIALSGAIGKEFVVEKPQHKTKPSNKTSPIDMPNECVDVLLVCCCKDKSVGTTSYSHNG